MRLNGRVALVTGASRGLGAAIAERLAADGAHVVVGFRSKKDDADTVVEGITAAGGSAAALQIDVSDQDSVRAGVAAVIAEHTRLHVLVNNAGIVGDAWFLIADPAVLHEVLQTNLTGVFLVSREVGRHMAAHREGVIVNIGSVSGMSASPGQAMYAASKGGMLAMTKTVAAELAPKGVRVNAVVPGLIDSGMTKRLDRRSRRAREEQIPMGRLGTAAELAAAVSFLACDDASYITGQALVVDGGLVP